MYHTQEKWQHRLSEPKMCERADAWLGTGYYFWDDFEDAIIWGNNSKRRTKKFEIYSANIETSKMLNTVFNEEHYTFYKKQIEKVGKNILKKTGKKASILDICDYINNKAKWREDLDGVLFQDLPTGDNLLINKFPYRKRIQAAIYNLSCIENFSFEDEQYVI